MLSTQGPSRLDAGNLCSTNLRSRRTNQAVAANQQQPVGVFNVQGAGCVRHLSFVFGEQAELTPRRFHAQGNIAFPAATGAAFPIATTDGTRFLTGYMMDWCQQGHNDMVFPNSGVRLLLDGQTDPHGISGWNVEDDLGFSWDFNDYQTVWSSKRTIKRTTTQESDTNFCSVPKVELPWIPSAATWRTRRL